ncbi:aspartate aminotransferase family protein [Methylotenera sp.]|uniref:aspartate aminotransferase family protein n=1 Tax=Methylotenera sp. TaxID=2051956 RepID=UPI002732226E|nr:aspartate aminotransferase family protein [Methylotenera sp.]MDP2070127.1 aspartate aminotransferase family protein [Methylotenera sp.]MDP3006568.1 aspartate aminotransferase family protein [Methylotenera sp.]
MLNANIVKNAIEILAYERTNYLKLHPRSIAFSAKANQHFLYGVPMHWMNDWGTPVPLFVQQAQGAHFSCADDIDYTDFCLGDTGAMFGHSPLPVAKAIAAQANSGYTTMLPSTLAPNVGEALAEHFGLPYWQLATTATDANRFVLRWARAVTGRQKLLVFDGCYHGTIDDTMVDMVISDDTMADAIEGKTANRASLLGQVYDLGLHTVAVPFNDSEAVERELAKGNIACVLTEPALTNCGMVLPKDGFIKSLRELTKKYDSLLVLDETHTISTGRGGWAKANHVTPDFLVIGKPIAGGLPASAYGFSTEMAARMKIAKDSAPSGHSGIGTTLSGNMMTLAAIHATLTEVATAEAYTHMLTMAEDLERLLTASINSHKLLWNITRLGARLELQFCAETPKNAQEARDAQNETLESAIHLYLLNRGVLLTPFHNMMLVCPATNNADLNLLIRVFNDCLDALTA